jgi:hypothetical protein
MRCSVCNKNTAVIFINKQKNKYIKKIIYICAFLALIEVSKPFFIIGSVAFEF